MKRKAVSILLALTMFLPTVNIAVSADNTSPEPTQIVQEEITATSMPTSMPTLMPTVIPTSDVTTETSENVDKSNSSAENDDENTDNIVPMFDGTDLTETIKSGKVTIDTDGQYYISDVDVTKTIVVKSGVKAELTINNVKITSKTASPIEIEPTAQLTLHLSGENTLTAENAGTSNRNYAGIAVSANDTLSDYATLIIDGDGKLDVKGALHSAAIGAGKYSKDASTNINGKIIINGGTINATGGNLAAAIGGGNGTSTSMPGCEIQINGGIVTATSGVQGTAIGAGNRNKNGTVTINGGYVKTINGSNSKYGIGPGQNYVTTDAVENIFINGGSVDATFRNSTSAEDKIQDKDGNILKQVVFTMPSAEDMSNVEVTVGSWKTYTDGNAKLYVYVKDDTTSYSVTYNGKIYVTNDINNSTTLTEFSGSDCVCTDENASVKINMPDTISINKIDGSVRQKINTDFIKADNCDYPIHDAQYTYTLTTADENETSVSEDLAKIENGYLVANYQSGTSKIRLHVSATLNGYTFTDSKDISITGDDTLKFDLSDGNIKISQNSSDADKIVVTVGTTAYNVLKDSEIFIMQSKSQTDNTINISQGVNPTVILSNINIVNNSALDNSLHIGDGVTLTLKIKGKNNIESKSISQSALAGVAASSKLIIKDYGDNDGEVTFKSYNGAGISRLNTLTIESGTVYAYGGQGGAGIGGGSDGAGFNVLINGGNVYAYGDVSTGSNAAGIGGGTSTSSGRGGNTIINGGYVKAVGNGGGKGIGIGNGGNTSVTGAVTINGGSVDATFGSTPNNTPNYNAFEDGKSTQNTKYNEYLVETSIEGITGEQEVEYSMVSDDYTGTEKKIKTHTDENGKLYLYANAGNQWVRIYKDGQTYYRYAKVSSMSKNTFVCTDNIEVSISSFKITGQIGTSEIDNVNRTVTAKVPYNIMLNQITPTVEFVGSFAQEEPINFNNQQSATYTITGNDKSTVEYTINLVLDSAPEEGSADIYDIAEGIVKINESYVTYGGTRYKPNSNGYIITGKTSQNTVLLDYASDKLPPVKFKDLEIRLSGSAIPVSVMSCVDITVEGTCLLSTIMSDGLTVLKSYSNSKNPEVTITSDSDNPLENMFSIQGGMGKNAINLGSNTKLTITGVPTVITSATTSAITGDGEFITDSKTYMNITEGQTSTVKNTDGNNLYQLKATLVGATETENKCTYNNIEYYIGDDHILCLMVPSDTYDMAVTYGDDDYVGSVEVDDSAANVDLYSIYVESVTYDSTILTSKGGDVEFEILGSALAGNMKIVAKNKNDSSNVIESAVEDGENGKYVSKLTFPENQSTDTENVYELYYVIKNQETKLPNNIIVDYNKSFCNITEFEIDGQIGQTTITENDNSNIISINMPYDHQFEEHKYYTPKKLTFVGKSITPSAGVPTQFTLDDKGYMRASYTVTAKDNTTKKTYQVRLSKNPTPKIKSLSFSNPTTSDGGTITVIARGVSTNSIQNAENENNRNVYIYSDDGIEKVKADMMLENGVAIYVAEINVPANTSDTNIKEYVLKAKIGDTEQTDINEDFATLKVPRQARSLTGIKEFNIENQVGETEIDGDQINIVMPYDADITAITPNIELDDIYASYTPLDEQDFSNDSIYTVTAEDGVTKKDYTVHVQKEAVPYVSSIEFENPEFSSAGVIKVKVNGENLASAANAINAPKTIEVSATLVSGDSQDSEVKAANATVDENGDYNAYIVVPKNNSSAIRTYNISVKIGNTVQTLSGNTTLTVPAKEDNQKALSSIVLTEDQGNVVISGNDVYVYVPYNTNLNHIEPKIFYNGVSCSPESGVAQNFNNDVVYRITAQDTTYNDYTIHTIRQGVPNIDNVSMNRPKNFKDTDVTLNIEGEFIPYLINDTVKDTMKIWVTPRNTKDNIDAQVTYDTSVYGGKASAKLNLPVNNSYEDIIYDIHITINDIPQIIGSGGSITVPKRKTRNITRFLVNGQTSSSIIDNENKTVTFAMPYNADLTNIVPTVAIDGDSYTPQGAQDFDGKTVQYTVSADNDEDVTYNVKAVRDGLPTISSVKVSDVPDTYIGGTINIDVEGTFFKNMKVKAIAVDNEKEQIDGIVSMTQEKKASATVELPKNTDTEKDKEYKLEFYLDDFEEPISYSLVTKITVPRRKTRAITNIYVANQVGSADIQDKDIYIKVQYDTDISKLTPSVRIDGDSYSPEGEQNFDNNTKSLVYKVSAADDTDREYTVHISRDGKPTLEEVGYTSPTTFKGGLVTVSLIGIFFEDAKVYAVPIGGGAKIEGKTLSFEDKSATVTLDIPTNNSTEAEQEYRLEFVIDGFDTNYSRETKITVPRRTSRKITEFTLPDIQEGETKIDGTDIYVSVPYVYDISSVTPQITFDADNISPSADTAMDFSNLDNPVKYTLSSVVDEDVTYTVHITRVGDDPYLESLTVADQYSETEYDGDNVSLVLKSSAKLDNVEPILQIHGDDYSPKGVQDFKDSANTPIVYTVKNKYGVEHKYYVTITKRKSSGGGGSKGASNPTPTPTVTPIPTTEPTNSPNPNGGSHTPKPTEQPITKHEPYINGYEENGTVQFRPDNTITRAEVAKILTALDSDFDSNKVYDNKFSDVHDGTWYQNYINFAIEKNYISGDENGLCRPEDMISRAEFASIIARYIDIEPLNGEDKFTDIARFDWCRKYINALAEKGIVTGYENGEFLPDNKLTRSEAVAIINRIIDRKMTPEILEKLTCPFSDVPTTHWAYNDILLAACEY